MQKSNSNKTNHMEITLSMIIGGPSGTCSGILDRIRVIVPLEGVDHNVFDFYYCSVINTFVNVNCSGYAQSHTVVQYFFVHVHHFH